MLYKRLIINGVEFPVAVNQAGQGAPTESTEGAPGMLYMDTDSETLYKCTAAENGIYTWKLLGSDNALPAPESARVGQYICVLSVDESGRITGVKAVDAPESGQGPQGVGTTITATRIDDTDNIDIPGRTGIELRIQVTDPATGTSNVTTVYLYDSDVRTINGVAPDDNGNVAISGLPAVTAEDNDKILQVVNGAWAVVEAELGGSECKLPEVTEADNDKLLQCVNGVWTAVDATEYVTDIVNSVIEEALGGDY